MERIAAYYFQPYLLLPNYKKLIESIISNMPELKYQSRNEFICFNASDTDYLKTVQQNIQQAMFLNKTLWNPKTTLINKWNNLYMLKLLNRVGKSIVITNYTELFTFHEANTISPNTRIADVQENDGFYAHFRDSINTKLQNQTVPLQFFRVDFEYYLYFMSMANLI